MSGARARPENVEAPPPGRIWVGLFIFLLLLYTTLVWAFPHFPSQDGPVHLQIAQTLTDYDNPDYPVMAQYYERHWSFQRNPFTSLVLVALGKVMPMLAAEKVYLTLIVVLFPLTLYYALSGITRNAIFLAFAAFPLTYSFTLMMGFYAFSFAISLFLLTVGLWLRLRDRWTITRVCLFGGALIVTYFVHIFAAFNVIFFVGLATIWEISSRFLNDPGGRSLRSLWRILLARGIPPLIAVSPILIIVLAFMATSEKMSGSAFSTPIRLLWFMLMSPALTFDWQDTTVSVATNTVFLGYIVFAAVQRWKNETPFNSQFWFVFLSYFCLMLFVPTPAPGSAYILERLMIYVFVVLLAALASSRLPRQLLQMGTLAITVLSIVNLGIRYWQHDRANEYIAEYLSGADLIAANSTVLSLTIESASSGRTIALRFSPILHAAGYIVINRHVVDLKNFQAGHGNYYPVTYRPALNPYRHLSPDKLESVPPRDVILTFPEGTTGSVDYVILWGSLELVADQPEVRELTALLQKDYDLLMESGSRKLMRLYRRRDGAGDGARS